MRRRPGTLACATGTPSRSADPPRRASVYLRKGKFQARGRPAGGGSKVELGRFSTAVEAAVAYAAHCVAVGGEGAEDDA